MSTQTKRPTRPNAVILRLTFEERRKLEELSEDEGLALSAFLRRLVRVAHRARFEGVHSK